MRIGLDLQIIGEGNLTGVGNYALRLAQELVRLNNKDELVFFVSLKDKTFDDLQIDKKIEIIRLPKKSIRFWTAHMTYARIMKKAKLDLLHGPANVVPANYRGRFTVTVHDLAIYKHPEWFPQGQYFSTKYLFPRSIKKAKKIIVPSVATKKDLIELFHIVENKIHVIPHGVEERFFKKSDTNLQMHTNDANDNSQHSREDSKHSSRYILFVGTLEPRKNVRRLLGAYQGLPDDIKNEYELVIAGGKGWGGEVQTSNVKYQSSGVIKFLGYVADRELPALFQEASLFVYPSLYEGFGLPVLEAMAAGVPVVTSNLSSLPEVGSGSAILVNPYSADEIRDGMIKLIRDGAYSSRISAIGRNKARQYTWERTAQEAQNTWELLK